MKQSANKQIMQTAATLLLQYTYLQHVPKEPVTLNSF